MLIGDARSPDSVPGGRTWRKWAATLALNCVIKINGQLVRPDAVVTFPHFVIIRVRLYRVSQLLVPKSREMIFQAAHHSPMAGHLGCDKTRERIMARFYWPGIYTQMYSDGVRPVASVS